MKKWFFLSMKKKHEENSQKWHVCCGQPIQPQAKHFIPNNCNTQMFIRKPPPKKPFSDPNWNNKTRLVKTNRKTLSQTFHFKSLQHILVELAHRGISEASIKALWRVYEAIEPVVPIIVGLVINLYHLSRTKGFKKASHHISEYLLDSWPLSSSDNDIYFIEK